MSDQPEALRLADAIRSTAEHQVVLSGDYEFPEWAHKAAAELRRQHSEIEQLKAERDALQTELHIAMDVLQIVKGAVLKAREVKP